MPSRIDEAIVLAQTVSPLFAMVPIIGQALPLALQLIQQYRSTRDAIEALHPGTSGMLPDTELFDLLQRDAQALVKHSDALIAKWSAPAPGPGDN